MATDFGCCEGGGAPGFNGFSLSLTPSDEEQANKFFNALAEGGNVQMPLGKTFFSPCFGVVQDKYGVNWMVVVAA
jgi:PhnB protein